MGVILRAHPVRGESHIQRNATGEDATVRTKHPPAKSSSRVVDSNLEDGVSKSVMLE